MAEIRGGYGLVSRQILRDPTLSVEAKAIYAYLCSFAGSGPSCFPGVSLMMHELHMGKDRFYKNMGILIDAGIVKKVQERNGNRWGNTVYTLNHNPDFQCTIIKETENQDTHSSDTHNKPVIKNSPSTNSFSMNSIDKYAIRVCELLNQAKGKVNSKGRLRPNTWVLQDLIRQGLTIQEIEVTAQDLAETGADVTWISFAKHCKDRRRK